MSEYKVPTEVVELPSRGLLYPKENPLSSGTVEIKYMTAKEEDILTNINYIKQGIVIDKLLSSLIVSKINYDDLILGDKSAIIVAARVFAYGKNYEVEYDGSNIEVDLTQLNPKKVDYDQYTANKNEFEFVLPFTKNLITFKILTHGDEKKIDKDIEGLRKINKDNIAGSSTKLKYIITSINGERSLSDVWRFVDNELLAADARALRAKYAELSPDIDFKFSHVNNNGIEEDVEFTLGPSFFWPDSRI